MVPSIHVALGHIGTPCESLPSPSCRERSLFLSSLLPTQMISWSLETSDVHSLSLMKPTLPTPLLQILHPNASEIIQYKPSPGRFRATWSPAWLNANSFVHAALWPGPQLLKPPEGLFGPVGIVLRLISLSLHARLSAVQANNSQLPGLSMTRPFPLPSLPLLRETPAHPEQVGGGKR